MKGNRTPLWISCILAIAALLACGKGPSGGVSPAPTSTGTGSVGTVTVTDSSTQTAGGSGSDGVIVTSTAPPTTTTERGPIIPVQPPAIGTVNPPGTSTTPETPPSDTTAPLVTLVTPKDKLVLAGGEFKTTPVVATATDDVKVTSMQATDPSTGKVFATSATGSLSAAWNYPRMIGPYTLVVSAKDAAGNTGTAHANVSVTCNVPTYTADLQTVFDRNADGSLHFTGLQVLYAAEGPVVGKYPRVVDWFTMTQFPWGYFPNTQKLDTFPAGSMVTLGCGYGGTDFAGKKIHGGGTTIAAHHLHKVYGLSCASPCTHWDDVFMKGDGTPAHPPHPESVVDANKLIATVRALRQKPTDPGGTLPFANKPFSAAGNNCVGYPCPAF